MNKVKFFLIFILLLIFLQSCQKIKSTKGKPNLDKDLIVKWRFGLVTGLGGLGDKAFNDMQYNGMILASKKYGIAFDYETPKTEEEDAELIEKLIKTGSNVIICGGGYHMIDPIDKLAPKYSDVIFVLLDDIARNHYPNVASITFRQNEGSFLCGVLSAKMSKTKKIGVVAAQKFDVIDDFVIGYKSGAQFYEKDIQVNTEYINSVYPEINPWASPEYAKKIAEKMIKTNDVDVIYQVASGSGTGVFAAAKENNIYAIGVDSNQDHLAKSVVLTSMMKRLDRAILYITEKIINNDLKNQVYSLGLAEGGVELSPMEYSKNFIPADVLSDLSEINKKIINQEIEVPTTIKK